MNPFQDAFISYGRADSRALAARLNQRLIDAELEIWFDFDDIPLGVDYQKQINAGIDSADNFIFIIAPHSVNSPYCLLEIELAVQRGKRIIPVLHVEEISHQTWQQRHPQGTEADWAAYKAAGKHSSFANMHPEISKINWVYCREGQEDFEAAVQGILAIMARQQDYVRSHTILLLQALEWEQNQKQTQYLLVGEARTQAETWLSRRFKESQPPCNATDLHCEFITESTKNAYNLMSQVFLAHDSHDLPILQQIRRILWREGITVWTSQQDIQSGEDFAIAINRGIEQATNVVYLLSPNSLQGSYCQQELAYAHTWNKRIIPVLITPISTENLPSELISLQYVDLSMSPQEETYGENVQKLLRILKTEVAYYEEHKFLLVKALKWERQQYHPSLLYRGYNLRHAEAWLKLAQNHNQHPAVDIQAQYILESQRQVAGASLDVFISYSRVDSDFARRLNEALQIQGKTTWFDQESIASGADFQAEIYHGIENADHFLFIISPNSVNSPYCAGEVEHARKLNKRVVTVLHRPVAPAEMHPALAAVQWLDFRDRGGDFTANVQALLETLDTDLGHLRTHTRLLVRALEWHGNDRNPSFLLRGDDLTAAEAWLAQNQTLQPQPTDLQQAYIANSRTQQEADRILLLAGEKAKQRVRLGSMVMGGMLAIAAVAGVLTQRRLQAAIQQADLAQQEATAAQTATTLAEQKRQDAEADATAADAKAREADAKARAADTQRLTAEAQAQEAVEKVQAAEAALEMAATRLLEANVQLETAQTRTASAQQQQRIAEQSRTVAQRAAADAQTGTRLEQLGTAVLRQFEAQQLEALLQAIRAGQELQAWIAPGRSLQDYPSVNPLLALQQILSDIHERTRLNHDFEVNTASFNARGDRLLTASGDGNARLWNSTGQLLATLPHGDRVTQASFSPPGNRILTADAGGTVRLWTASGQPVATLVGHRDEVTVAQFSPGGDRILTASFDQTARLWMASGEPIAVLEGHEQGLTTAKFSPQGNYVVTGSTDRAVRVWNSRGQPLAVLTGHPNAISDVAISPDGAEIAVASQDKIHLWNRNGERLHILQGHLDLVNSVRFSPGDGETLVTASDDQTVRLWARQTGQPDGVLSGYGAGVRSAEFSPDGKTILTAAADTTARLWSRNGVPLLTLRGHSAEVTQARFSSDGRSVITASFDGTARIWDVESTAQGGFSGPNTTVFDAQFSPNGGKILTITEGNQVQIWSRQGQRQGSLRGHRDFIHTAQFSSDGQFIVTASRDRTARIWTVAQQQEVIALPGHTDEVLQARFSPDGDTVLTTSADHTARLWKLGAREVVPLTGHRDKVTNGRFSPDGQQVLTISDDGTARLWDTEGTLRAALTGHQARLTDGQFSPDGQRLLTASEDGNVRLWTRQGSLIAVLSGHGASVQSARFSPDSGYIVTAAYDNRARLWTADGDLITIIQGHQSSLDPFAPTGLNGAVMSPDSDRIATIANDNTVRLWDLRGRPLARWAGQGRFVQAQFSPGGEALLTVATDGTAQLWPVETLDQLLARGCRWVEGYLTYNPQVEVGDRALCP